jgi:RNA polymerase sigma factor (sigma-70 family)
VDMPMHEPRLDAALARLNAAQRVAIILVHGLDWSYQEAADALDVPVSTVRNHLHRGLVRLRRELGA